MYFQMLLCCSHYALLACSGLEDNKLNDVKRRWKSPQEPNSQLILGNLNIYCKTDVIIDLKQYCFCGVKMPIW